MIGSITFRVAGQRASLNFYTFDQKPACHNEQ